MVVNYCIHCDCCHHLYHHHFTHVSYIVLPKCNYIQFIFKNTVWHANISWFIHRLLYTPVPSQNLSWDAELSVPPHQVSQEAGCCQALSYPNHPNPTDQVTSWLLVVQSVQKRLPPGVRTPGWLGAVCKDMKPVQVRVSRAHPEERRHHHHCLSLLISNSPTLNQCHIDLSTPNKSACNQKLAVIKKCWKMFNTADNMGRTCFKIKTRYRKLLLQHVFFHAIESQKVQRCVLRKTHTQSQSGRIQWYNAHEAATHGKATWISCHPTGKLTAQSRKVYPGAVCHVPVVLVALDRSHVSLLSPQDLRASEMFQKGLSIHSSLCTVYISNSFQVQLYWQPKTRSNSDIFWPYESTELK